MRYEFKSFLNFCKLCIVYYFELGNGIHSCQSLQFMFYVLTVGLYHYHYRLHFANWYIACGFDSSRCCSGSRHCLKNISNLKINTQLARANTQTLQLYITESLSYLWGWEKNSTPSRTSTQARCGCVMSEHLLADCYKRWTITADLYEHRTYSHVGHWTTSIFV